MDIEKLRETIETLNRVVGAMERVEGRLSESNDQLAQLRYATENFGRQGSLPIGKMLNGGRGIDGRTGGDGAFAKFGKILRNIYHATTGDQKARSFLSREGVNFHTKAMEEGTGPGGGYLVPMERLNEVLRIPERGVIEPLCRYIPMKHQEKEFPDLRSSVTAYWVGENADITESEAGLGMIILRAQKLGGITTFTNELLEDDDPATDELLGELFAEAMLLESDSKILSGTGVSGDPCIGILVDPDVTEITLGAGKTSFANIDVDSLSLAISKIAATILGGCRWVMHPDVLHYIRILKTKQYSGDTEGEPIWKPSGEGPGTLYGYPITESSKMPGAEDDAAETPFITFGNFRYFVVGDRMQLAVAIDPFTQLEKYRTRVRWLRRLAPHLAKPAAFVRIKTAAE